MEFIVHWQGYFQLLFTCIERLLSSMKVKKIVLPAAEEAKSIWTKKFGFETIAQDQVTYHFIEKFTWVKL